jgi:hypothetical protein
MYNPVKDGVEKTAESVQYIEAKPPSDLSGLVHSSWELKTVGFSLFGWLQVSDLAELLYNDQLDTAIFFA